MGGYAEPLEHPQVLADVALEGEDADGRGRHARIVVREGVVATAARSELWLLQAQVTDPRTGTTMSTTVTRIFWLATNTLVLRQDTDSAR